MSAPKSAVLVRWGLVISALLLVELLARGGAIDPLILPPPSEIAERLWETLGTSELWSDLVRTGTTAGLSILFGVVVGVLVGTFCWRVKPIGDALEPYLSALYAMPTLVFYPILLALMGLTVWPIVTIASVMVVVPVALNTMVGFRSIDPVLPKLGRSMRCSPTQQFFKVLIPAATPLVVSGVRLGCIYAVIGTVAMEFILADGGLGFRVGDSYRNFDIITMWSGIVVVTVFTLSVTTLLGRAERRIRQDMV